MPSQPGVGHRLSFLSARDESVLGVHVGDGRGGRGVRHTTLTSGQKHAMEMALKFEWNMVGVTLATDWVLSLA